jgi:hypothetical protein
VQVAVVQGKLAQGLPGAVHQCVVDDALVGPGQSAQLGRQREGDEEVWPGDELAALALDPALAVGVLAVRAQAVAAGVRHHAQGAAVVAAALGGEGGRQRGAAALERGHQSVEGDTQKRSPTVAFIFLRCALLCAPHLQRSASQKKLLDISAP